MRRLLFGLVSALALTAGLAASTGASADPIATLDRNGAWVTVEAYGPNVVRVTIAADKAEALKAGGYGILTDHVDNKGFSHSVGDGDTFTSNALSLHINAAPPPHVPGAMEKYFAPSLAPVGLQVKNAKGETILNMGGWEMAPHEVAGEATYQVGASFAAPGDEHFYGLGQNQESLGPLDLRNRTIDCKHWYDAPGGETVCIPMMISSKGYAIVWDNPSDTHVSLAINGQTHWTSEVGERVLHHHRLDAGGNLRGLCAGHGQDADPAQIRLRPDPVQGALRQPARGAARRQYLPSEGLSARHHGCRLVLLDAHGPDGH